MDYILNNATDLLNNADFILNNATDLLNNGLLVSRATPPIARGKGVW